KLKDNKEPEIVQAGDKGVEFIESLFFEVEDLLSVDRNNVALVMALAAFEATGREIFRNEMRERQKNTPKELLSELYKTKKISVTDLVELEHLTTLRNLIAHGIDSPRVSAEAVKWVVDLSRRLINWERNASYFSRSASLIRKPIVDNP